MRMQNEKSTLTTEHNSFNFAEDFSKQENREPNREGSYRLREQATQSTRWMPWCFRPMKDAETGETFQGSCMQAMILEYPNGATPPE